jgi:hypothetical protein
MILSDKAHGGLVVLKHQQKRFCFILYTVTILRKSVLKHKLGAIIKRAQSCRFGKLDSENGN